MQSVLEEAYIARDLILEKWAPRISQVEILCVNDGSTDQTESILKNHSDKIHLIKNDKNLGYGAALQKGFTKAKGQIVGFHDADGTFKTSQFVEMLNVLLSEDLDMVVGKRFSNKNSRMPLIRKFGNNFFALILNSLTHRKIVDCASGLRILRKDAYKRLQPLPRGMDFIICMTIKSIYENLRFKEVPINYLERIGKSKLSVIKDGIQFLTSILYIVRNYSPLTIFGIIGIFSLFIGFILGIKPTYSWFLAGRQLNDEYIYQVMLILLFAFTGGSFILNGIVANVFSDRLFRTINPGEKSFLTQLIYKPSIYNKVGIAGAFILLLGVFILFGIGIDIFDEHWAPLSLTVLLWIVGIQMINIHLLISLISDYARDADYGH